MGFISRHYQASHVILRASNFVREAHLEITVPSARRNGVCSDSSWSASEQETSCQRGLRQLSLRDFRCFIFDVSINRYVSISAQASGWTFVDDL